MRTTVLPLTANNQPAQAYSPPVFNDTERLAKIHTVLPVINKMYEQYAAEKHFPGYAFGIIVDGKLIYSGSSGYADIEKKLTATPNTMFRIASMTKSFTAMAILNLRDQGKLKLDDPAYVYIPALKSQKLTQDSPDISIRDLLIHTAGFPQDDPWGDRNLHRTDEELIDFISKGVSFSNVTGTTYEYSNLAYAILGYIIKQVSGTSYQTFIANTIWEPLGIQPASWEFAEVPPNQLARGYRWQHEQWQEESLLHDGSFAAMGGMMTSIEAFSHYVALHQSAWPPRDELDLGPLKRSSIREMHYPWAFNKLDYYAEGKGAEQCTVVSAYGYGLRRLTDCRGNVYVGHSGGLPGFGSNWFIMPDYGIGVVLFTNVTYGNAGEINFRILNTIIKTAQLKPRQLPPAAILTERQKGLLAFLPGWENAQTSDIFAENFFLDMPIDQLRKETTAIFAKMGKIQRINPMVPENQLRGHFIIEGSVANAKISFTLTPHRVALIQKFQIEEISN